jgi:HlyD family secretion protein
MRRALVLSAVLLLALAGAGVALFILYRADAMPPEFQGWVEADIVFVSPDETGRVTTLAAREGSAVKAGEPLFELDDDLQRAAVSENEALVTNAKQAYDRARVLLERAVGSQKTFDDAESVLRSAEARLNSAKTRLERRRMASPVTGTIQEVYFRVGEMVQSGRPILSIVPPGNVKVRFFVPQAALPSLRIGERVQVHCDGCRQDLSARVSFISAQAEYTPPVIYSLEERARLVFRIEAIPEQPGDFRIGQPASVALEGSQPKGPLHARL